MARIRQRHLGGARRTSALHTFTTDVLGGARSIVANARARSGSAARRCTMRRREGEHSEGDRAACLEPTACRLYASLRQRHHGRDSAAFSVPWFRVGRFSTDAGNLRPRSGTTRAARGLVYRYEQSKERHEGAFAVCSFWEVDFLTRGGKPAE